MIFEHFHIINTKIDYKKWRKNGEEFITLKGSIEMGKGKTLTTRSLDKVESKGKEEAINNQRAENK